MYSTPYYSLPNDKPSAKTVHITVSSDMGHLEIKGDYTPRLYDLIMNDVDHFVENMADDKPTKVYDMSNTLIKTIEPSHKQYAIMSYYRRPKEQTKIYVLDNTKYVVDFDLPHDSYKNKPTPQSNAPSNCNLM